MKINFELNVTLQCNLACPNCNRLCHLKPAWAEDSDMSVAMVERFVDNLRTGPVKAKRVKVAGGEPLLHPELAQIIDVLLAGVRDGVIDKIKIDSNGTLDRPAVIPNPALSWSGRKPSRKVHLPTLWSPTDLGLPLTYPCTMPRKCGISLDKYGYLPCSMAISIVHTLGQPDEWYWRLDDGTFLMENMAGATKPIDAWLIHNICRHCIFAAPKAFREEHCRKLKDITLDEKVPTRTWGQALDKPLIPDADLYRWAAYQPP